MREESIEENNLYVTCGGESNSRSGEEGSEREKIGRKTLSIDVGEQSITHKVNG